MSRKELDKKEAITTLINQETQASLITKEKHSQITKEYDDKTSQAFGIESKSVQMLIQHDANTQAQYQNDISFENQKIK